MNDTTAGNYAPRPMSILVDHIAIEDGAIDPPAVGAVASFPLLFIETSASEPDAVTVRGDLEPADGPLVQLDGGTNWFGLLHGDGWTATWHGRRRLTGSIETTGRFMGVMDIHASGRVRGRVRTVRVVSVYWRRVDTRARWEPVTGRREYRQVDRSPRWFADERMLTDNPPAVSRSEIGVLITLDLGG